MVELGADVDSSPENKKRRPGRPPRRKRPRIEPEGRKPEINTPRSSDKDAPSSSTQSRSLGDARALKKRKGGRPKVLNKNASLSSKQREARKVAKYAQHDLHVLELALRITRRKKGLNNVSVKKKIHKPLIEHTKESALALYLDIDSTKAAWNRLSKDSRARNARIHFSYPLISAAKRDCEVPLIESTGRTARAEVKTVLHKSVERLGEAKCLEWEQEDLEDLEMDCTCGSDLSSSHPNSQQGWDEGDEEINDPELSLSVTMVNLLRLRSRSGKYEWINPTPGSTRFCRPLKLSFEKETTESIKRDYAELRSEINELQPYSFVLSNKKQVRVTFKVHTTLYDGKSVNAITNNPSNCRCSMCHCTQAEVAEIMKKGSTFSLIHENLQFGLGLLHVNLRSLEILLQLAYKKKVLEQGWIVRKQENKDTVIAAKLGVREELRKSFKGVRVDQVRHGFGTTNTGNVARRLFSDPKEFSKALDVDEEVVTNLSLLLRLYGCKLNLKHDEVRQLSKKTHEMFFEKYDKALMNPTLHKFLAHGSDIAEEFPLPAAYFSEDALEAWHKILRRALIVHARQCSRKDKLFDLFNLGMHLSDPLISLISLKNSIKREGHGITRDMVPYIVEADLEGIKIVETVQLEGEGSDDEH